MISLMPCDLEVALSASSIAGVEEIGSALFDKQRDFAEPPGLIADGRDMGAMVFLMPH